jgi:hypothetical protein
MRPGHGLDLENGLPGGSEAGLAQHAEPPIAAVRPRGRVSTPGPFTPVTQLGVPTPFTSPSSLAVTAGLPHHKAMLRRILHEMFVDAPDSKIEAAIEKAIAVMEDRDTDISHWSFGFGFGM